MDDEVKRAYDDARRMLVLVEVTGALDDAARRLIELAGQTTAASGEDADALGDAGARVLQVADALRRVYWIDASRPVSDPVMQEIVGASMRLSDPDDPEGER